MNNLASRVENLTESLTVQKSVARRWRILTIFVAVVFAIGLATGYRDNQRIVDSVHSTSMTQVQSCKNANSVREASVTIWSTVFGLTSLKADARAKAALTVLLEWVIQVYEPHDCSDLDRVYKAPPPPDLSQFFSPSHDPGENTPE